jgi:hypothetical protein
MFPEGFGGMPSSLAPHRQPLAFEEPGHWRLHLSDTVKNLQLADQEKGLSARPVSSAGP